jgi:hypothetical protein
VVLTGIGGLGEIAVPALLTPVGSWDGFGLTLGNATDEVLLLDNSGAFRVETTPFTNYATTFPSEASLKRYPADTDYDDCSRDLYVSYSPSPGAVAGD